MIRKLMFAALMIFAVILVACGEEYKYKTAVNSYEAVTVMEKGTGLEDRECSDSTSGDMVFVTDSLMVYFCDGEDWLPVKGEDGVAGEPKVKIVDVSDTIVVRDTIIKRDTVRSLDTITRRDTIPGLAGVGCTAVEIDGGYKMLCGEDSVGVILNGADGKDGNPGDDAVDGNDGKDGEDGKDGLSAYEIAKKNGFEGSEAEWLASLNGKGEFGFFQDSRDNAYYKTVKIGNQTWMTQNLNYDTKDDDSFCYENVASNCVTYGRMYSWSAANEACPDGWHLPDDSEWAELLEFVSGGRKVKDGDVSEVGFELRSASGWNAADGKSGNGVDLFGFAILPAGYYDGSKFRDLGNLGNFWSADEIDSKETTDVTFKKDGTIKYATVNKTAGESVRCLQD